MVSRNVSNTIEMIEYVVFVFAHALCAFVTQGFLVGRDVLIMAGVLSFLAYISLYRIKKLILSQIGFIICSMAGVYLIGTRMGTLAFGICVYMVTGALIPIMGNMKLNLYYVVIVNIAIVFGLATQYDTIIAEMRLGHYVLTIMVCEAALVTECLISMFCQQKVEEMQTQNALLNIAQKSKDEFIANMSHEIRTPMNAIVGISELVMRDPRATDRIREYGYNIHTSGENLLAIINDILDYAKLESGKIDLVEEGYSIASVIEDAVNTAVLRRGYKDIELIVDAPPNLPKQLCGDPLRNRQIVINILNNAVKFTEKGYVYMAVSCFLQDGVNWLRIIIEDTGSGIRKEDQEHLFESFNRLDTAKNRSVEGTGLGLAICKRFVDAMHGRIHLESEYGKGTTVTIELPQPIEDKSPFLSLKEEEHIHVVTYENKDVRERSGNERYMSSIDHLWRAFQVPHHIVTKPEELTRMVEDSEVTHIFTSIQEYADNRQMFDEISMDISVFAIYDPQYPARFGGQVKGIRAPYYSISITSALNGESFYNQYIDEKEIAIEFQAPEARVMVVDDNAINLRVAEGVLKLYNTDTVLAGSAGEALELLKEQDIDLVLMDHMMPEMDGVEAVSVIRRIGGEYESNLPVVALTANVINGAREMFLENGFQDFLPKPLSLRAVDAVLRKWLPPKKLLWNTMQYMRINEEVAVANMGGQRDIFKELLEYCLELEEKRWDEIQECFEKEDYKEYGIRVHALKGAMRSLGIDEMAMICEEQEHASRDGRIDKVRADHENLHKEYDRANRSIEIFLKDYEV